MTEENKIEENKISEEESKVTEEELKIEELKAKLEACEKQRDEYLAGWQRQKADFLNYQKEEEARRAEWVKFANADLLQDLLLILDSFDLALLQFESLSSKEPAPMASGGEDSEKMRQGIQLIRNQLESVLKKRGLEEIKALGEKFDPMFHEAVGTITDNSKEDGIVAEVVQKGYRLHERILRPAKVKVSVQSKQ